MLGFKLIHISKRGPRWFDKRLGLLHRHWFRKIWISRAHATTHNWWYTQNKTKQYIAVCLFHRICFEINTDGTSCCWLDIIIQQYWLNDSFMTLLSTRIINTGIRIFIRICELRLVNSNYVCNKSNINDQGFYFHLCNDKNTPRLYDELNSACQQSCRWLVICCVLLLFI